MLKGLITRSFLCSFFLLALTTSTAHGHPASQEPVDSWIGMIATYWVMLPVGLSAALYAIGVRNIWKSAGRKAGIHYLQVGAFIAAWLILVIALFSPVDTLGNLYFSMHMVQHELLMVMSAPLFIVARPLPVWAWALKPAWRHRISGFTRHSIITDSWKFLTSIFSAWFIHAAVLWGWHVPVLFEYALTHPMVHDLQHLTFFFSALLFWWSVMSLRPGTTHTFVVMVSLFTTVLHTGLLGALLTFAGNVWYPTYAATVGGLLTPLEDQQLGGLIMWVPGGLGYLAIALTTTYGLLKEPKSRPAAS